MSQENGFILTAGCFDSYGKCELNYYGRGKSGPFKLIFTQHTPLFFINRSTPTKYTTGLDRRAVELKNFSGNPVDALYFQSLNSYFETRRMLQDADILMFESDIRAEDRFIMERFINGGLLIEGKPVNDGQLKVFTNPRIKPTEFRPELTQLSLDIETGTDDTIYSIAFRLIGSVKEEKLVLMRGVASERMNAAAKDRSFTIEYLPDEKSLFQRFTGYINDKDPDLIIGWHVIGFDLSFIKKRAEVLGLSLKIGRGHRQLRINEKRNGMYSADIEGRLVIDGPQTLRTAFYKFENYRLETVAQELLGRGKDITPDRDKVAEIERRFADDKEALARYNLEDSILVTEIFKKTAIVDLLITRSLITGLPINKIHMSVAAFDHFMLPKFHRKGIVAPDTSDVVPGAHAAGGHVFTSPPGLYPHVVVLDFKSLYPTIMRTFFIDPYSRMNAGTDGIETPTGIKFSRTEHILPAFLKELMAKRSQAKKNNDRPLSQAVKILLNSFYGVMGTTGCRFYHPDLPTAITGTGQWILKNSAAFLREQGWEVIYGDTDSVFVRLKEAEWGNPIEAGEALAVRVNNHFTDRLMEEFNIESKLELEFEKHYKKFFLPPMRYTAEGAKKKYAGLLDNNEIEFRGLEIVRSDWTSLARNFQQELFRRFFNDEDLVQWIKDFVEELKNGSFDDQLLYKRRLKRSADQYTKTSPPHVKAARKLDPDGGKKLTEISYIMTSEGPVSYTHLRAHET